MDHKPEIERPTFTDKSSSSETQQAVMQVNVEKLPSFESLNALQKFGAKLSEKSIQLAISMGYLNADNLKSILDFGAGDGGPTFALVELGKVMNSRVDAVETNPKFAEKIIESGILPKDRVYVVEGVQYLESNTHKYDLVTAFFLGPDIKGTLFRKLVRASANALNKNGNLLITSDAGTFSAIKQLVKEAGAQFNFIHGARLGDKQIVADTLIIPQNSCLVIK